MADGDGAPVADAANAASRRPAPRRSAPSPASSSARSCGELRKTRGRPGRRSIRSRIIVLIAIVFMTAFDLRLDLLFGEAIARLLDTT